jgi:DNA-binding NtrC family response regulator
MALLHGEAGVLPERGWGSARRAVLAIAQEPLRAALAAELRAQRWVIDEAASGAQMFAVLEREDQEPCAAVLLDSWLPDLAIEDCIAELRESFPGIDLLALEGLQPASLPGAAGLQGPWRQELLHALQRVEARQGPPAPARADHGPAGKLGSGADGGSCAETPTGSSAPPPSRAARAVASSRVPTEPSSAGKDLPEFCGDDAPVLEMCRRIRLVAGRRTPVLVHGASGTGKELVARAIHRLGAQADRRFVAINCGAIPEALVESELFGHARGAFTGAVTAKAGRIEAAAGGTVFLDEVGELPPSAQSKLLRFLETGEMQRIGETETILVETRILAATHRKLGAMVEQGLFRLDLLHRLAVFLIETPALAGRPEAIRALADRHLARLAEDDPVLPGKVRRLSQRARARLEAHAWPGNVRELEHTLERAVILAGDAREIDVRCIDFGEALYR